MLDTMCTRCNGDGIEPVSEPPLDLWAEWRRLTQTAGYGISLATAGGVVLCEITSGPYVIARRLHADPDQAFRLALAKMEDGQGNG